MWKQILYELKSLKKLVLKSQSQMKCGAMWVKRAISGGYGIRLTIGLVKYQLMCLIAEKIESFSNLKSDQSHWESRDTVQMIEEHTSGICQQSATRQIKRKTQRIKRKPLRLRTRIKRLAHRTICFSKQRKCTIQALDYLLTVMSLVYLFKSKTPIQKMTSAFITPLAIRNISYQKLRRIEGLSLVNSNLS